MIGAGAGGGMNPRSQDSEKLLHMMV